MAKIDMSDDDSELDRIRGLLLGGGGDIRGERTPPAPPVAVPAATALAEPTALDMDAAFPESAPAPPPRDVPASLKEDAPRPSFAAARPRQSGTIAATGRPLTPAPASVQVQGWEAPSTSAVAVEDATPTDALGDDLASIATDILTEPRTADTPALPSSDADLSALLGVDVASLRKILSDNPGLLDPPDAVSPPPETDEDRSQSSSSLARSDLATQGWRAWLVKLGIPMRKGAAERFAQTLDSACEVIRRELDGPVVIGVTSYRGSCGKTSSTVLLARLLAEIRGHDILALDTDLHGTLLTRSVGDDHPARSQGTTMPDAADRLRDGIDVRDLARDGGDGYVFIPGSQTFRANALGVGGYQMIVAAARQVYPIILVDMAQLSDTELYSAVLGSLDGLVMLSPTAEDGVGYLYRTQSELQNRGVDILNGRRITALNNVSAVRSQLDTEEFARGLKHRDKRDVVEIPYDRHLAAGKQIEFSRISTTTKAALTLSLAALIDTFG